MLRRRSRRRKLLALRLRLHILRLPLPVRPDRRLPLQRRPREELLFPRPAPGLCTRLRRHRRHVQLRRLVLHLVPRQDARYPASRFFSVRAQAPRRVLVRRCVLVSGAPCIRPGNRPPVPAPSGLVPVLAFCPLDRLVLVAAPVLRHGGPDSVTFHAA